MFTKVVEFRSRPGKSDKLRKAANDKLLPILRKQQVSSDGVGVQLEIRIGAILLLLPLAVMGWYYPGSTTALLLALLLHESAHALAGSLVGCKTRKLILSYYPAIATAHPHHRGKNAWIALAAPALNLLLFVVFSLNSWSTLATGQLMVCVAALLPYPGSDSWRAVRG
jgi:hypothetical protein